MGFAKFIAAYDFSLCTHLQDTVLELEFQGVKKQFTMLQVTCFVLLVSVLNSLSLSYIAQFHSFRVL